jgi:hypothetical protein
MTSEALTDPIEKEDKQSVFVPDESPNRIVAKRHEGETQEEFMARREYIGMVTGFFRFASAKRPRR